MPQYYLDVAKDAVVEEMPDGSRRIVFRDWEKNRKTRIAEHKAQKKRNRLRKIRIWLFGYDWEDRRDRAILYAELKQKESPQPKPGASSRRTRWGRHYPACERD